MYSINCKGRLIDLSTPRIMGIINVTPDSFYDGGVTTSNDAIIQQASAMLKAGASFLDIGGYSSRPGAANVTQGEELERVIPAIEAILKIYPEALISIDTFRSGVASTAIQAGAALVNDISGGLQDAQMLPTVARLQVPYIMMHMRGNPQNMQSLTQYEDVTLEVIRYFSERLFAARDHGINDLICDPGFGFAKTREQNFQLLQELPGFRVLDSPLLVGISRKSMIYKTLDTTANQALNGTSFLHAFALQGGAHILRVHDVPQAMECVRLWEAFPRGD